MSNKEKIKYLLHKLQQKQLTAAEELELKAAFRAEADARLIREALEEMMAQPHTENKERPAPQWEQLADQIMATDRFTSETNNSIIRRPIFQYRYWFAAAAVACIGFGTYLWFGKTDPSTVPQQITQTTVTPPAVIDAGRNGAILTLDDNTEVLLDSAGNGLVADQQGAKVLLKDGELLYDGKAGTAVSFNKMSTPRGRQFQLLLSDGTRVWLNAASSIRYPTIFNGHERKVQITGEVYFEVAKQADRPFKVAIADKATIDVLGTGFNVNAYEDENRIRTTLIEGSVKVSAGAANPVLLKPGQQAAIAPSSADTKNTISLSDADIHKVMAWKNGVFNFEEAGLDEVMRQLSRWYDVDVKYENGKVPDIRFGGKMSRNIKFEDMLKALELSKVKFRQEGRTLVILP